MNVVSNYVRESLEELQKVTWPTKNQAVKLTIIVFIFCLIVALFLGAVDYLLNLLNTYLIKSV